MHEQDSTNILNIPRPKLKRETRASFAGSPMRTNKYESHDLLRFNNSLDLDKLLDNIQSTSFSEQNQSVNQTDTSIKIKILDTIQQVSFSEKNQPDMIIKNKLNNIDSLDKSKEDAVNLNIIANKDAT
jgi:hypothetical protein